MVTYNLKNKELLLSIIIISLNFIIIYEPCLKLKWTINLIYIFRFGHMASGQEIEKW
jgi:hypothetical protein